MRQHVPVLMYHSVGVPNQNWHWNYLTCPFQIFERQLKWLVKAKYKTINLYELYNYIFSNNTIPKKSIVLTFDDGYVDNWIYAYPLLKKYGLKATIFINPEFSDPRDIKRLRLDQCTDIAQLDNSGFLSWSEMREMEKDEIIDIQSHAMTHTHYPISDRIIDFRNPDDTYIRLSWNDNVNEKPFLQLESDKLKKLGEPVYEMNTSLGFKQYFPDPQLKNYLITTVQKNGGNEFFKQNNWKSILFNEVNNYKSKHDIIGKYESDKDYEQRVYQELKQSKIIISKKLNKSIDFLCWPEGSGSEVGITQAHRNNYKMSTAAKDIPKLRKRIPNSPKLKIDRIRRFSPVSFWNGIEGYNAKIRYANGIELSLKILAFKNILFSKYWSNLLIAIINKFK